MPVQCHPERRHLRLLRSYEVTGALGNDRRDLGSENCKLHALVLMDRSVYREGVERACVSASMVHGQARTLGLSAAPACKHNIHFLVANCLVLSCVSIPHCIGSSRLFTCGAGTRPAQRVFSRHEHLARPECGHETQP